MTPHSPFARTLEAARGFRALGMYVDAWDELEKLEPEERAHPDVLTERVQILMEMERWDSALAIIGGMLNAGASDPELLLAGAKAARRAGDFAKAKAFYLQFVEPFGETAMVHYWLAACECQLGDLEAAKRHLTECFRRDADMRASAIKEPLLARLFDSMATQWPGQA